MDVPYQVTNHAPEDANEYGRTPIVVRPVEAWRERRYVGEIDIFVENEHPLTIEVPCPPVGVYSYKVEFVRADER